MILEIRKNQRNLKHLIKRVRIDQDGVVVSNMPSDPQPRLQGFLSNHESDEKIVEIVTEPDPIYIEEARDSIELNFDLQITGLTTKCLMIRFIKCAIYDDEDNLVTFRHLNHNGVGTPGIHTIGKYEIDGQQTLDVFNPFHRFPLDMPLGHLRYMFTFYDSESKQEYYYGNVIVEPVKYNQKTKLSLPIKGTLVVLDGHDFYSHHRRFAMSLVRDVTGGKFASNFSRYGIDFTVIGTDGNTREMDSNEFKDNYDFHFSDVKNFFTHEAVIYAPADGEIVDIVNDLEDLYDTPFNMDAAIGDDKVKDIAGNYVVIKHASAEYSHLFHLLKGSVEVGVSQKVKRGAPIAKVGFSGASTLYSHLHYQLMDGKNFLNDNALPCKFSNLNLILGSKTVRYDELSIDTGDLVRSEPI